MASGVRTKYHIGINNKGFILRGTPGNPGYVKEEAPSLINQVGGSDIGYDQLNGAGWRYFAQSDWSGGFQVLKFRDDGSFKNGQNIDTIKEYGKISLQNRLSAITVMSGHIGFYGSHNVHNGELLYGISNINDVRKSKIVKFTSANVSSLISSMAGISAINSMARFGDSTLVGMSRTSGTLKTLAKYTGGTTISGFRSTNPVVRAVAGVGIRAYISEYIASLSGDRLSYATNLSAFTTAYDAGKSRRIPKILNYNGSVYFFIEEGDWRYSKVELYKYEEVSEKAYLVYTFQNLNRWGAAIFRSKMVIHGISDNKVIVYSFDGVSIREIFDDQNDSFNDLDFYIRPTYETRIHPFVFNDTLVMKGTIYDGENFFPGYKESSSGAYSYSPFCAFNNKVYAIDTVFNANKKKFAILDTSKYVISGNIVGSNFGHQMGAIDKLVNSVAVNCKPLATGQTIELYYSTNEGTNYTSIGKLQYSSDGAIAAKVLNIPSGVIAKTWLYKAQLVGSGTSTPTLHDISFQYRPMPDTKRRWGLAVDAGDNIMLLNRQQEQRDGKAIMAELWLEKDAKRMITFEDVDSFSAKVISAMSSAATSALISGTHLMPPKGRFRVMKSGVAEEMTYTSANGRKLLGISRAQKGTKSRAYTSADSIDNYYTAVITNLREELNNTDDKKTESIAKITLLEV